MTVPKKQTFLEFLVANRTVDTFFDEPEIIELLGKWLQQKRKAIIDDVDWTTNNLTKIGAKRAIDELLEELE